MHASWEAQERTLRSGPNLTTEIAKSARKGHTRALGNSAFSISDQVTYAFQVLSRASLLQGTISSIFMEVHGHLFQFSGAPRAGCNLLEVSATMPVEVVGAGIRVRG